MLQHQDERRNNLILSILRLVAIIILIFAVALAITLGLLSTSEKDNLFEYESKYVDVQPDEEALQAMHELNKKISLYDTLTEVCINIAVSTLIFILFDLLIKNRLDKVNDDSKQIKSIFLGGSPETITAKLRNLFGIEGKYAKTAINVKIICYGTGSFNGYIYDLIANPYVKTLKIVVCSPELIRAVSKQIDKLFQNKTAFAFDREEAQLSKTISEWKLRAEECGKQLDVCETKVLPTIRGILIMDKSDTEPLFCAFQPYYMTDKCEDNKNLLTSDIRKSNPFTVIVDEDDDEISHLAAFITEEFNRLANLVK